MLNYRIEMNIICMDFIVKLSCRKKQRIKIIDNNDNFFCSSTYRTRIQWELLVLFRYI